MGTTQDEMAGWHHQLNGHGFGWSPGAGDGQGGLACFSSWDCKESDTTGWLNWTELNRKIWPWSTEWSRARADRVLPRECTGHSKHPLPTTQGKTLHMDINRRSLTKWDWLHSLSQRWRSSIQSSKTRPGADDGSDHELLIAKFKLNWRK